MKKVGLIAIFVFSCLLFCGCGKESVLVCKQKVGGFDITLSSTFKGNTVSAMNLVYLMDVSNYNDTQVNALNSQDYCTLIKSSMAGYENAFDNCNQAIKDKKLLIETEIDVDKISEEDKKGSPEKTKEDLENQGYSCTIE